MSYMDDKDEKLFQSKEWKALEFRRQTKDLPMETRLRLAVREGLLTPERAEQQRKWALMRTIH